MSVFLRNVILDIYTYLCNIFAYFENFMRYIIYKIHILYNNVRCERVTRICVQMCASIPAPARHDESFNMLFLIKVGKYCASRNDIACGGDITS